MNYDFTSLSDRRSMGSLKYYYTDQWNPDMDADVVPLSTADMEFKTAPEVIEGLKDYLDDMILGYTIPGAAYYDSIKSWMKRRHQWDIEDEWIVPVPGIVTALHLALEAFTEPGDGVIIFRPVYHQFGMAVESDRRKEVNVPLIEKGEGHYEIDFDLFEEEASQPENKMLIFCSPHNPVGRVWTKEELQRIDEISRKHDLIVVCDEIWHDIVFEGQKHTAYPTAGNRAAENTIICTSVSKTFSLAAINTSNIIIADEDLRQAFVDQVNHGHYAANAFGYKATELAYNEAEAWLDAVNEVILSNHHFVSDYFKEHMPQVKAYVPEGTYVSWIDFRELGLSAEELERIVHQEGQFMTNHGRTFGEEGAGFERANIALPQKSLEIQLERLVGALKDNGF